MLRLSTNCLSGVLPKEISSLPNLISINVSNNYFSCSEIQTNKQEFDHLKNFSYDPQHFKPLNYDVIKNNVFDTLSVDRSLGLDIIFPMDTTGLSYQWFRNGNILTGVTQPVLQLDTVQPDNVGNYTLSVVDKNCLLATDTYVAISDTIKVILKGYDLQGNPLEKAH